MKPARIPLEIFQGGTFSKVLGYGQPRLAYRKIVSATSDAPCVLTTTDPHGLPEGWAFRIANARGMVEINSPEPAEGEAPKFYQAIVLSPTTLELNSVDASAYKAYSGGGVISYSVPVDLDAFTGALMQIRPTVDSTEILLSLTTENGRIVLDNVAKQIVIQLPALITADIQWLQAVYGLELYSASGIVTPVAYGTVKVTREVPR